MDRVDFGQYDYLHTSEYTERSFPHDEDYGRELMQRWDKARRMWVPLDYDDEVPVDA